jgi:hypothetical protein
VKVNIGLTFLDEPPDEHVLGGSLKRDEVHAVLAADVAALQPVNLKEIQYEWL